MNFYRETFSEAPATISIPKELRKRKIEIIILPLDEEIALKDVSETDKNVYSQDFLEKTFGSLPDLEDREPQPQFDIREEIQS